MISKQYPWMNTGNAAVAMSQPAGTACLKAWHFVADGDLLAQAKPQNL